MKLNVLHRPILKFAAPLAIASCVLTSMTAFASTDATPAEPSAASTDGSPSWVRNSRDNESYLVNTRSTREPTWNEQLFKADQARDMRADYESRVDAQAAQDNAGLTNHYDEESRFDEMRNFAKHAVNSISHFQIQSHTQHLKETIENTNFPKEPIAAAVLTASLYAGRSMRFRLMDGTPVDTRVGIKDKIAQATVPLAPGITGTVAYNPNNPAGVCSYDNACAMVSKELMTNVSAVLNSAQKGRASVVYNLTF